MSPLNRDDLLSPFRQLKSRLVQKGWETHTHDIYKAKKVVPDAVLFLDIPKLHLNFLLGDWRGKTRSYVVLQECEVIKPQNWATGRHAEFDGIFTWADALVDGKKYFKVNFALKFPQAAAIGLKDKEKFCALIAGNKRNFHPLELYSERISTIRWFEKHHPEDFDLYGFGWDRFAFGGPRFVRALNRLTPLTKFIGGNYSSYRGSAAAKLPLLRKYKFSICYENAQNIPGYITEKIFDCFFAGCVPVYWGAPDVTAHIPESCFVDRRKFKSHEELYQFLKNMSDAEYLAILAAIRAFISSPAAYPYTDQYYAETVAKVVAGA